MELHPEQEKAARTRGWRVRQRTTDLYEETLQTIMDPHPPRGFKVDKKAADQIIDEVRECLDLVAV